MAIQEDALHWLASPDVYPHLKNMARGIERETLRVTPEGHISQTPHPASLGSSLTHSAITTDYSEALLEIITQPHPSISSCLQELKEIHQFVSLNLEDEYLWPYSMPPQLESDEEIPIAFYGSSLVGTMKRVYRKGLGLRYGRKMQSIAGIHYNISFPDDLWEHYRQEFHQHSTLRQTKDHGYFNLVREFLKKGWMLTLLTGASPLCHESFSTAEKIKQKGLEKHKDALYAPWGSSLRMGGMGYHNDAQSGLFVCYDSLDHYIYTLSQALHMPSEKYKKMGLSDANGRMQQLSENILQIENEFYATIRPKQVARSLERPTLALQRRGVAYIEVRNIDLDPEQPTGISEETAALIEIFITGCLLNQSRNLTKSEDNSISSVNEEVAMTGRSPEKIYLKKALDHWQSLEKVAELLELANQNPLYRTAYQKGLASLQDPSKLQSSRMIDYILQFNSDIKQESHSPYTFSALNLAQQHKEFLKVQPLEDKKRLEMEKEAAESLEDFQKLSDAEEAELKVQIKKYLRHLPEHPDTECTALSN